MKSYILATEDLDEEVINSFTLEGVGRLPPMEFCLLPNGSIFFRYVVDKAENYPGFDGLWRQMTEEDRKATLRMGGPVADWLSSIDR